MHSDWAVLVFGLAALVAILIGELVLIAAALWL